MQSIQAIVAVIGRCDLSTVIDFVSRRIPRREQDTFAEAKDFAWFALRPVSGAHVSNRAKGFLSGTCLFCPIYKTLLMCVAGTVYG